MYASNVRKNLHILSTGASGMMMSSGAESVWKRRPKATKDISHSEITLFYSWSRQKKFPHQILERMSSQQISQHKWVNLISLAAMGVGSVLVKLEQQGMSAWTVDQSQIIMETTMTTAKIA